MPTSPAAVTQTKTFVQLLHDEEEITPPVASDFVEDNTQRSIEKVVDDEDDTNDMEEDVMKVDKNLSE